MAGRDIKELMWGATPIRPSPVGGTGGFVERDGERYYRVANYHAMAPFFTAVVSGFDHWMFLSTNGGLACGRRSPENALFPYVTDDQIHDADATTGPLTAMRVAAGGQTSLWRPFARGPAVYALERHLYRNGTGNRLIFEEVNHDLGLAFSYSWSTGDRFGFIRRAALHNRGPTQARVELLDGVRNLLPWGVGRAMQATMSTLVDAYKRAEAFPELGAALYALSSVPTDLAEPSEALNATVAWTVGLEQPQLLVSEDAVAAFCAGAEVNGEAVSRGKRGAFFVQSSLALAPGAEHSWYVVADVAQGPAQLPALFAALREGVTAEALEQDIAAGTERLQRLAASADALQHSADRLTTARHFSNTLYNIMRGGVFVNGYQFPADDLLVFVDRWNRPLRARFEQALPAGQRWLALSELRAAVGAGGDADMERLALEYLPLTFSRRHGDPSRPWNEFLINIRNADGSNALDYQGNWRDIFQNWEALAISFPEYIESFIAKFVNASTADGYNPYRVSSDGFDWEVLDPAAPWSNIGYWGDHQVNYLQELVELSHRYHPGRLIELLGRDIFVYANVPYRLKGYAGLLEDPRHSVEFDHERAAAIAARVAEIGNDGKLVTGADGSIHRVNLLEKLLLPALAKIGNFVPGGGIWMNTQRPEWNDANNALVGYGLSMVTLCYLRRYLALLAELLAGEGGRSYPVSREVMDFLAALDDALGGHRDLLAGPVGARARKALMDALGMAGERYREAVYRGLAGERGELASAEVIRFIRQALEFLDHSLACGRREDGLYHAYRLLNLTAEGCEVEDLQEMLEGQVAALNSGCLGPAESLALLDALRASDLYRADCDSYLLYPDRDLPPFLERNVIPRATVDANAWIRSELDAGHGRYVLLDSDGRARFNGRFGNARELRAALAQDPAVDADDASALCKVYEDVFGHRQFTGRSGSMYKYEGLGSIYWHMVSKLSLATAKVAAAAQRAGADPGLATALYQRHQGIREGLGIHRSPGAYGAFPTEPYSHTPSFAGVQQPGMTGQVKEDIIVRFAELGVRVEGGAVRFEPRLLRREEFLAEAEQGSFATGEGGQRERLPAGSLAFTLCGVPVVYRLADEAAIRLYTGPGEVERIAGCGLGPHWSASLFQREGRIRKLEVDVPLAVLQPR